MARTKKKGSENGSKRKRKSDDVADWRGVDTERLAHAIATITIAGGAVRFGYTADGGAYSIGLYGDGEPYTEYVRPAEDIDAYIADLTERWAE